MVLHIHKERLNKMDLTEQANEFTARKAVERDLVHLQKGEKIKVSLTDSKRTQTKSPITIIICLLFSPLLFQIHIY